MATRHRSFGHRREQETRTRTHSKDVKLIYRSSLVEDLFEYGCIWTIPALRPAQRAPASVLTKVVTANAPN